LRFVVAMLPSVLEEGQCLSETPYEDSRYRGSPIVEQVTRILMLSGNDSLCHGPNRDLPS
jgi:hypothetical protein